MDGGTAIVGFDDAAPGHVSLTGPATYVGAIQIELEAESQ